jgi:hypothetical protein
MRFDPAHDARDAAQSDNANPGFSHAGFRPVQLWLHRHATCLHFDCPTSDATSRNHALFTGIANEGGDHLETTHSRGRTPPLRRSNFLLQRNRIIGEVPNSRYRSVA